MDARNDNKREVRSGCIIVWLGHQPSDWLVFCVCVCVHWWRYSTVNKFTSVHSLPWDAGSCECCLFPQLHVWLDATLAALGGGPCYLILTSPLQQFAVVLNYLFNAHEIDPNYPRYICSTHFQFRVPLKPDLPLSHCYLHAPGSKFAIFLRINTAMVDSNSL